MNTGPTPFPRQMLGAESLINAAPTWDGLMNAFKPAIVPDRFDPGDDMKLVLFHFYNTVQGRQIVDWLFDLTARAPFPHVGSTRESAALAAAKHEARAAVGLAVARAITDGEKIWNQRSQSHEDTA